MVSTLARERSEQKRCVSPPNFMMPPTSNTPEDLFSKFYFFFSSGSSCFPPFESIWLLAACSERTGPVAPLVEVMGSPISLLLEQLN